MPSMLSRTISTIRRKPPTAADGMTDEQANPEVKDTSVGHDLVHLKGKQALTLAHALKDLSSGEPLDDRKLLLEHGVSLLQGLPSNSGLSHLISDGFIGMLWNDLPHPVGTNISPQARYRAADGSGNVPHMPSYGAAGQPYSRSVPPVRPKAANMPDPELVFDQLLRRDNTKPFKEHPHLSRMFFGFATMVIHEIFATDQQKPWINKTSSYVELSTIYGNNQEEQDRVRTKENGRIHKDTIASDRMFMMPPHVVTLAILFARHHNHIAERIFEVNEHGKYKPWKELNDEEKKWQDEDIFQLSRNVNVAFFASIVLRDYVSAILNTVSANSDWNLQLGKEIKLPGSGGKRLERGTGASVSAEFAVLYHWHSALSAGDCDFMNKTISSALPGKDIDDITPQDWYKIVGGKARQLSTSPNHTWEFGGLKRGPDGSFDDVALAEIIKDAVDEPAHALGARGSPAAMRIVEVMGMLQARNVFNVCTLNEFRQYLNLKPFESFLEWNSDPEVAAAAERLYGHVDNLELYPGLHAEETKPDMPGSGVCPPHTVGRGILDDAVALVRGDRFLTYDLNSSTLTSWGMSQLTPAPGAYGGMLAKVFFTTLPYAFGGYSTYALLPFYTPKVIRHILKKNKVLHKYDTDRQPSDRSGVPRVGLHTHAACKDAFADRDTFRVPYAKDIDHLAKNKAHFFITYDDHARHDPDSARMHRAFFEPGFEENVDKYYREHTQAQIKKCSIEFNRPVGRRQLDVVRDICNQVPLTWLSSKYAIPLKTAEHPHGLLTPFELQSLLTALFVLTSFNQIPKSQWLLREVGDTLGQTFFSILRARMKSNSGLTEKVHDYFAKNSAYEVSPEADHLYHTLINEKTNIDQAVLDLGATAVPVAGNITQQSALLIDLFLTPGYEYAKDRVIELAKQDTKAADEELVGWVWEGMRHSGVVFGLPRMVAQDVVVQDGDRRLDIKAGERIIIATSRAHMDPAAFPNPERLDPTRDRKQYLHMGSGIHYCFGARLVIPSIRAILKEVFKLPNIRRAAYGGHFKRVTETLGEDAASVHLYLDHHSAESPIPASLKIEYDAIPAAGSSKP